VKRIRIFIILTFLFASVTISFAACEKEEARPIGSVIEFSGDYIYEETYEDLTKFRVIVRVTNIGDDGVIGIHAKIDAEKWRGRFMKSTELYLETGQETTVTFEWWVGDKVEYSAWATPSKSYTTN
jgi:hypothetical protein